MKLSNVLASIKGPEKTASAAPTAPAAKGDATEKAAAAADTGDRLKAALKEATAPTAPAAEKKASTGSPVADLMKTASEVAGAEHEALLKEAQFYGAAVCDGFMARLSQYNESAEKIAAQQPQQKTAAASSSSEPFEKFAAENPQLVKEAAELGYGTAMGQIEKLAEVAYSKGYNEAVSTIYKCAHASFVNGFEDTLRLVQEIRQ